MLSLALIIFAVAALLGVYLLIHILNNKNTPKGVVIIHGSIAACGILLIIIYSLRNQSPLASLLVLILAAIGGFYMFWLDITDRKLPKMLAVGHGVIALLGIALLVAFIFRNF